jgi:putative glycosyltransferase
MKLSVVSTLYQSKIFLDKFLIEIEKAIQLIQIDDYELIFVNDGSPDNSLHHLITLKKEKYSKIKIIDLSRNFGHHYAMQAGLVEAKGDLIFLIDNDLETHPNVLVNFYTTMQEDKTLDVVYGFQEIRKGNFIERTLGGLFWILINKLSDTKIPHNILTERLMTKEYVKALLRLNDANLFLGGMMFWVGFNQQGCAIEKGRREGASTYSLKKRTDLMLQAVTSFSGKPLVYLFYFGLIMSFLSALLIIHLIVQKFLYVDEVQLGWTSLVAINILVLGLICTFLGVIGIYVYKIFKQVQGRPNAIIKKIHN